MEHLNVLYRGTFHKVDQFLPMTVHKSDIDKLAAVVDEYGQVAKNELLNQFFDRISKQLRNHDLLAKLGDDQFGVVIARRRLAAEDLHPRCPIAFGMAADLIVERLPLAGKS